MPRKYPPEAKREALSLYIALGELEAVAREMRRRGYARYSVETLRRWRDEGGWEQVRADAARSEAAASLALDADRVAAEMLADYQRLRGQIKEHMGQGALKPSEGIGLLLKVDGLIRALLAQRTRQGERVDKPALALEVLELVIQHLADHDPLALEALQPHIEDMGETIKERYAEAA